MFFVQSLMCLRGYDSGRRFLLINLACYSLFLLLSPFLSVAPILLILLLLVTLPLLATTSMRRIHDAAFATPLAIVPVLIFLLSVFGITYFEHGARYSFLLLSLIATAGTTLISNARVRRSRVYRFGYSGPVIESVQQGPSSAKHYFNRIEPTIAGVKSEREDNTLETENGDASESLSLAMDVGIDPVTHDEYLKQPSSGYKQSSQAWEQLAGDWLLANKKLATISASIVAVIFIGLLSWGLMGDGVADPQSTAKTQPVETIKERLNKIELPDNFFVMHDQFNAITIAWQGTVREDGEVWSPTTAQGDKDCLAIRFNNGDSFRTLKVIAKNQGDYYADFSPVDSQAIIQDIALQSRFSLCGIDFSLKGTQAVLMTHRFYADLLTDVN